MGTLVRRSEKLYKKMTSATTEEGQVNSPQFRIKMEKVGVGTLPWRNFCLVIVDTGEKNTHGRYTQAFMLLTNRQSKMYIELEHVLLY